MRPAFYDPNRATLEIRSLPVEYNTIAKLNDHFSKFGTIVNLQVCSIVSMCISFSSYQKISHLDCMLIW